MDDSPRVIAFIPARGGSKGLPRKNIRTLAGKPLLAWTVDLARSMAAIDRVVVSTDDPETAEVSRSYGAEILWRPGHLAGDDALPADVVRDAIRRFRETGIREAIMVYLQPTSPLRGKKDITACLKLLHNGYNSAATFTEAALHPYQAWRISGGKPFLFVDGFNPWRMRQRLEKAYQLNGAVYAFWMNSFPGRGFSMLPEPCGAVLMPKERSIDIDDMLDFELVEILISGRASK